MEMPKRLYTYCCRLCLHNGSVHELLDIFSVEKLDRKIFSIFNIKVTPQDVCTTNICLKCFNEALTLDRQMQMFKQQKQTVLENQQQLKKGPAPATATSESSAASHTGSRAGRSEANVTQKLPVGVSTTSSQALLTAADANRHDGSNSSAKTVIATLDKTNKLKTDSKKKKGKTKLSHSCTKVSFRKKEPSGETLKHSSKTPKSSSAAKRPKRTVERNSETTKSTGGNSQEASVCSNGQHSVHRQKASKPAKSTTAATDVKTKQDANHDVQHRSVTFNDVGHAKNVVLPNNAYKSNNMPPGAQPMVRNEPDAIQSSEQSAVILTLDEPRIVAEKLNNEPRLPLTTQTDTTNPTAKVSNGSLHCTATVAQSGSGALVAQKDGRSVPLLGAGFKPLQGGICSIPLANIPGTVSFNESRVAAPSTANPTGTSVAATDSLATDSQQGTATTTIAVHNACVPASGSQLTLVDNIVPANATTVGNRDDNAISSIGSAGTIKKRRHSTYIRVSSNLFDEPAEKVQFAMLNNNLFIRNTHPQTNLPPLATHSHLPTLPPGHRVQTAINPQNTMPLNNALNYNDTNQYSAFNGVQHAATHTNVTVSQRPIHSVQATANSTNSGISAVTRYAPILPAPKTAQPQSIGSTRIVQTSAVTNNTASNNYTGLANTSHNTNHTYNNPTHPYRTCYKCNLCSTYYLLEFNLQAHMRKVHNVEKNDLNCSTVYNSAILEKLMTRYRRKSIADPSLLSGNCR